MASSEVLQFHFKRHIYLVSAIVIAGSYVGTCALPSLMQALFSSYGFHTTMGLLASFHVVHLAAAVTYIELPVPSIDDEFEKSVKNSAETSTELTSSHGQTDLPIFEKFHDADDPIKTSQKGSVDFLDEHRDSPPESEDTGSLARQFLSLVRNVKV